MEKIAAIIAGGGRGERFSSKVKKQFFKIKGKPILAHSIYPFQRSRLITGIVLAVPSEKIREAKRIAKAFGFSKVDTVVKGGRKRQDSVYNALRSMKNRPRFVLIHDAVRPFVKVSEIERAIRRVKICKALVFATPPKNTIKIARGKAIEGTLKRSRLWEAHTPQIFEYALLMKAYRKAYKDGYYGTDDSELVERLGSKVSIFPCAVENMKITHRADLKIAAAIVKDWRW